MTLELSEAVELTELEVGVVLLEVGIVLVEARRLPDSVSLKVSGRGASPISPTLTCVFSILLVPTAAWLVLPLPLVPTDMKFPEPSTVV